MHGVAMLFSWSRKETTPMELAWIEYYFIPLMLLFCFAELFHNVVAGMADKLESSFALTSKMDRAS